ncbi:glycoside hydrolase family 47 protein [Cystobasidium minutum MCA 4210]|uniref:glycoside hydrolase family 47 protein n=1 Tax=Cystobasidium minutum MCA 4210 TaxID=1397322 RepID=UPI0034CDA0BD|eukprot:jgi/Rhomi1/209316/estExt_Genemark1.C_2_t30163
MSFALRPRYYQRVERDPELGEEKSSETPTRLSFSLLLSSNNKRRLQHPRAFKAILAISTFCLIGFGLHRTGRAGQSLGEGGFLHLITGDDSDTWSDTYRIRPKLDFVEEDGESSLLKEGAEPGRWPQDYPEAASYLRKNSIIRDVKDPWPEKPWIASVWLAPERFPPGLHGQPYHNITLPELGNEKGQKPEPGLHDPPVPSYPSSPRDHDKLKVVPRDALIKPKDWSPPPRMPQASKVKPVQAQTFSQDAERLELTEARRQWVKRAFLHAYEGYKAYAFGHDETSPVSRGHRDSYNAWGATLVDSLDLLLIMGLSHEYNVARTHVRALDYSLLTSKDACGGQKGPTVHLFETVIRYLGGLLSAYDLSDDPLMLARAKELGDWLLPAFNTASGWPVAGYPLGSNPKGSDVSRALAAEVGSLSMELTRLSQLTGDQVYFNAALRIQEKLATLRGEYGTLVSVFLSPNGGHSGDYTVGGMVDSYYEYLIKMVQLLGDPQNVWGTMYTRAVEDMYQFLAVNVTVTPDRSGLIILGDRSHGARTRPVQGHLTTFAGGMLALGSRLLSRAKDLLMGAELTESAVWAYRSTATGLMPEIMEFYGPRNLNRLAYKEDENAVQAIQKGVPLGSFLQLDRRYIGRPETIESVFYMYRITGDPKWQDYGWRMFTSWVKHSLTNAGFADIQDVNIDPPPLGDIQESFVLTETMKYYYLLFSPPDLISLDDYVFNTEAHPFKVPLSSREHRNFWTGPEPEVDAAYADPRCGYRVYQ